MAIYTINFSSNASSVVKDLQAINKAIANTAGLGKSIKLRLDTSNFDQSVNSSFKALDKNISRLQRRLNKISIGSDSFRSLARQIGEVEGLKSRGRMQAGVERLRGQASVFEGGSEAAMSRMLQALQTEASMIKPNTQEWVSLQQQIGGINGQMQRTAETARSIQLRESLGAFAPGSLARLESQLTILRNRAREIAPNTDEWRKLNKEILNTEKAIQKVSRRPLSAGQRMGAAGGAFLYGGGMGGGLGSALGGVAGGLMGGVPGAFTGAAVGQVADNLGKGLAGITSQASKVQQLQRGLALASIDAKDFAEAQAAVADTSAKLFIPIEQVTKSFAQLRVNTKQYGMSVEETKRILEGTILAVSAVGGSADDVQGALRAVVQILSKGSVQAEELRGQLGERFPGAVVKFAQANKLSFEELQKGLQQGQIGIKEFVAFAEQNYEDYAEFSKKLATAPEFAGRRLQTALEQLGIEFGSLFGSVGANIQDNLAEGIKFITKFIQDNKAYLKQFVEDWGSIIGPIANVIGQLLKVIMKFSVEVGKVFQNLFSLIRQSLGMANIGEARARLDRARAATAGKPRPSGNVRGGGPFVELSQAERAYRDLGGDAAFNLANQSGEDDLTFGGPGAGISLDSAGGDGGGGQGSKLASFFKEQTQFLSNQLQIKLQILQADRDRNEISETALRTESALLTLDYQRKIIAEQLRVALARLAEENLSSGDKLLKSAQLRAEAEQELVIAANEAAKAGRDARKSLEAPFEDAIREMTLSQVEQEMLIDNIGKGLNSLTIEQQAQLALQKMLLRYEEDEKQVTEEIAQNYKKVTKELLLQQQVRERSEALLSLRNRAELATIFDPIANRRRELEQQGFEGEDLSKRLTQEIETERLERLGEQLRGIASSIGDAFGNAFKGIITGTSSVREALAGMFGSIADSFADMVSQMISQWMRTQVLEGFQSIFSAFTGGLGGSMGGSALSGAASAAGNMGSFGFNPGAMTGGIPFTPFANGGIVKGPTLGLVGEGRYNEAVVPLPDGRKIPVDLGGSSGGDIATSIVVNVSNGQSSSETSGTQGNQLARELEGAVKQVILKETRPGGIIFSQR